jgi:tetratricopeptide (TPR) repeat protein
MTISNAHSQRRLSVAMVVRDAEESIVGSLESIRQVADEIVVVDTGSKDRTRELALPRSTRLLDFAWSDDFSAARNFCWNHVSGDWVFWLDAGEQLTAGAAQSLRELVDSQTDVRTAFFAMIQVPPEPPQPVGEQAARLRLMPNHPELRFSNRIRENTNAALAALDIAIKIAPFCIQRGSSEHTPHTRQTRNLRNAHLAALEIADHGPMPSPLLAIAEACVELGELQHGLDFYAQALALAPRTSTLALEAFYGILAALDQLPAAREKQIAMCNEALQTFPFDAQLLCAMGSYLQQQGRIDLACRSFEAAARFGQVNLETWHLIEIAEVATSCHARCQELLGHVDAAIATLQESGSRLVASTRLRQQLLDVYVRHNRRNDALAEVDRRSHDNHQRDALRTAVRGACLAATDNWTASLPFLQAAFGAGCRDELCLRWLTIAFMESGDLKGAEKTLDAWRSLGVIEGEQLRLRTRLHHLRLTTNTRLQDDIDRRLDAPVYGPRSPASLAHSPVKR